MASPLIPFDLYDRALIDRLTHLGPAWQAVDGGSLTPTESKALDRLVAGGLVEGRFDAKMSVAGFASHIQAQLRGSGAFDDRMVLSKLCEFGPSEWLTADGKLRGRSVHQVGEFTEIRLTDQGEQAKHDWLEGTPEERGRVFTYTKGFPNEAPPISKAIVGVEDYRIENTSKLAAAWRFLQAKVAAAQSQSEGTPTAQVDRGGLTKKRMTRGQANEKAIVLASADPSFATKPNARRWSNEIGCSLGLVHKLPFWHKVMAKSGKARLGGSPPNVKSFTPAVEEIEPTADAAELGRLVKEQATDDAAKRCLKRL